MTVARSPRIDLQAEKRATGLVATLVIDNADKLNALGAGLMADFVSAVKTAASDPELRALVITGAGDRAFVGGADIAEMAQIGGPKAARDFIGAVHACCAAVRDCPTPVIARIHGYCFGAGLELAAACDIRIAASGAVFGMPEVRLGIPSVVEAALLPRLIGWGRARRLLLTGESISAETAARWGLIEEAAPDGALDAAVERTLDAILACGPEAVRRQKALIAAWERAPIEEAIEAGIDAFADAWTTDEPKRMLSAFLAARTAQRAASGG